MDDQHQRQKDRKRQEQDRCKEKGKRGGVQIMSFHMFEGALEIQILTRLKMLGRGDIGLLQIRRNLYSLCHGLGSHGIGKQEDLNGKPHDCVDDRKDQPDAIHPGLRPAFPNELHVRCYSLGLRRLVRSRSWTNEMGLIMTKSTCSV